MAAAAQPAASPSTASASHQVSIEAALYTRLQAVSAVTALVSTRVYPAKKDIGANPAFPYVSYEVILSTRVSAMTADTSMVESAVRFHIWSKDAAGANGFDSGLAVFAAMRGALQRWKGTSATVVVDQVFLDGEYEIPEESPGVYHRVMDVLAHWFE